MTVSGCLFTSGSTVLLFMFDHREGSVIADILLHTVKGTSSDIQGILNEAVGNKKFGNAVVESFGEVKGLCMT